MYLRASKDLGDPAHTRSLVEVSAFHLFLKLCVNQTNMLETKEEKNIFHWTESILAQSHDDDKYPYWGINLDFCYMTGENHVS